MPLADFLTATQRRAARQKLGIADVRNIPPGSPLAQSLHALGLLGGGRQAHPLVDPTRDARLQRLAAQYHQVAGPDIAAPPGVKPAGAGGPAEVAPVGNLGNDVVRREAPPVGEFQQTRRRRAPAPSMVDLLLSARRRAY